MGRERKRHPRRGGADHSLGGGDQHNNSENTGQEQGFAYAQTFDLDRRFSVRFSLDAAAGRFEAEWSPHQPKGRKARSILPAYRVARDRFLASLDVNVAVIEL